MRAYSRLATIRQECSKYAEIESYSHRTDLKLTLMESSRKYLSEVHLLLSISLIQVILIASNGV